MLFRPWHSSSPHPLPPNWRQGLLLALTPLWLSIGTAGAATIEGRVAARGKELPEESGQGRRYESRKLRFAEKVDYSQLTDFVVSIEGPPKVPVPKPEKPVRVVVQENAVFSPHVLPILVGTTVEWPNEDDIYHNVFSFSEPRPFDLGLYKEEIKKVVFDKPGRVDIFCSIHKNMSCVILVMENPWFATADKTGRYSIPDVPPGTYRIKAWHERMPPQVREIVVPDEGIVQMDFMLEIKGIPQL
jgi:plastocyanin